ncbi:hypothetical protein [Streptomyces sp. NPDC002057]|uniref:hypothetical protein n=1 Tax=Streptomyces sp. NPDC002057 TaxID=3154664 RepID=UPI00332EFEE0
MKSVDGVDGVGVDGVETVRADGVDGVGVDGVETVRADGVDEVGVDGVDGGGVWRDGPGGGGAGGDGLLGLLGGAGHGPGAADRRLVTGPLVCRYCAHDEFEVTALECFCVGCCLPIGVQDGDIHGEDSRWGLAPSATAAWGAATDMVRCPTGHDLFHVAAVYGLGADGRVERLSVGLRCVADGSLALFVDDAPVRPPR